jgi:hypothetical protein
VVVFRDPAKFQALQKRLRDDQEQVADSENLDPSYQPPTTSYRLTRSARFGPLQLKGNVCFLCKSTDVPENLHLCSTKEVHSRIAESARKVGDADLTALLATADVIALEAKVSH